MSLVNTHKLMGFCMEVLILGVNTMYMLFCFFKLFPIGCIGLILVCRFAIYSCWQPYYTLSVCQSLIPKALEFITARTTNRQSTLLLLIRRQTAQVAHLLIRAFQLEIFSAVSDIT